MRRSNIIRRAIKKIFRVGNKFDKIAYPSNILKTNKQPNHPFIVTFTELGCCGELGNQLFQVAAVIGYARKNNFQEKLPYWYCKLSNSDYNGIFRDKVNQSLKSRDLFGVNRFEYFNLDFVDLPVVSTAIDLVGYFQCEAYFMHCAEEIKRTFQPHPKFDKYITSKYADILNIENKVAVQVRTGKRVKNDNDGHAYASKAFLEEAFTYYSSEQVFVIFADHIDRAKELLPMNKKYFFVENEKNYIDLFFMNKFNQYIISPSTFGWWGAWLSNSNNPKVVIKREWFEKDGTKAHFNKNNIIPERWISI